MKEVARIRGLILDSTAFPLTGEISGELLAARMSSIEAECFGLMTMFGVSGYWGEQFSHRLWISALSRLVNLPNPQGSYVVPFESIRRYPALLAAYAVGVAACGADKTEALVPYFVNLLVNAPLTSTKEPFVVAVNTSTVLEYDFQKRLPGRQQALCPFSDRLWTESGLREALYEVVPDQDEFTRSFDLFEYLVGILGYELHGWAPVGCFLWRGRARGDARLMDVVSTINSRIEREGDALPVLRAGAFGGSLEQMIASKSAYESTFLRRVY